MKTKTKTTYLPCVQGAELPQCRTQRSAENAVKDYMQANGGEQNAPIGGWGGQVIALCQGLRFTVCKIDDKGKIRASGWPARTAAVPRSAEED